MSLIEPIIEYLEIDHAESRGGANWELFSEAIEDGKSSNYLSEIKSVMQDTYGIYVFYDSMGRAIYVGKAEKQSLWKEANAAFNRDRGDNQAMFAVSHPTNNVSKVIRNRKIVKKEVYLSDVACFLSAYSIQQEHISTMEAFLIRAFANNLVNKKIESFRLEIGR